MSDKLGFGLEACLGGRALDAGDPQITDHTTANPYWSNNTRMNELALDRPAHQRAPIAPDPKSRRAHSKPSLCEAGKLGILRIEHCREHRITLHLSLSYTNTVASPT